jgi:hypothetical protein
MRFGKAQGFARFTDSLARCIAWWAEGMEAVERMLGDPDYPSPDCSAGDFNAPAVARFPQMHEGPHHENSLILRLDTIRLVAGFPESAFHDHRIFNHLEMGVVGHFSEHAL